MQYRIYGIIYLPSFMGPALRDNLMSIIDANIFYNYFINRHREIRDSFTNENY